MSMYHLYSTYIGMSLYYRQACSRGSVLPTFNSITTYYLLPTSKDTVLYLSCINRFAFVRCTPLICVNMNVGNNENRRNFENTILSMVDTIGICYVLNF